MRIHKMHKYNAHILIKAKSCMELSITKIKGDKMFMFLS